MTRKRNTDNDCLHTTATGRRCRMFRAWYHDSLCAHHARLQQRETEDLAEDLLVGVEDFRSAAAVNHVLGKIFELTARDRIKPRKAALLAYVGQLLLNSLPAVRLELSYAHALPSLHKAINNLYRKARHRAAVEDFERQISEGDGPVDRVTEVPEFDPAEQPIEPLKISSC
jgi:hypothetical protein